MVAAKMPKRITPLTPSQVQNTKAQPKPYKLRDGGGLFLLVNPDGAKLWRLDYRRPVTGRRNTIGLGTFSAVKLAEARERMRKARELLAAGTDPGEQRKADKVAAADKVANTFGAIAAEYFDKRDRETAADRFKRERNRFDNYLKPILGGVPIDDVTTPMLFAALRKPEAAGKLETVRRLRAMSGRIFRFGIATGRATHDPSAGMIGGLTTPTPTNFAAVTEPADLPHVLRALWSYAGTPVVAAALKLTPLFFVRHGELRSARWADIDLDAGEWRFIVSKTGTPHIVPLATQAVEILTELRKLTTRTEYVFPSSRGGGRHMSQVATLSAMRAMGLSADLVTNHGWRATARTILDEVLGFRPDFIEHQLAHAVKDANGRSYNRTSFLPERKAMMQAWADYLDGLRNGTNVVPIRKSA